MSLKKFDLVGFCFANERENRKLRVLLANERENRIENPVASGSAYMYHICATLKFSECIYTYMHIHAVNSPISYIPVCVPVLCLSNTI